MYDFLEFQLLVSIVQLFCLRPTCHFFFYFARAMVNLNNGVLNIGGILA